MDVIAQDGAQKKQGFGSLYKILKLKKTKVGSTLKTWMEMSQHNLKNFIWHVKV